ncbi:MAG TPA: DNA repair protein RadC [Candidatus Nanoarchaeia archaeon]|nr:DNA repair protein RadC [Candidatus Nanoarchaeia archaeon]
MKILEMEKNSRPRERLQEFGVESLSDAELLAIILRTGTRAENVIDMSNRLIALYGIDELFNCTISELEKIKGIGKGKAMQLLAVSELGKRIRLKEKRKEKIKTAKDVFCLFEEKLKYEKQEFFYVILLNTKNNIISIQKISQGILDASIIHPREIFKPAIRNSASRIILIHNHPSGDPTPSEEDLDITKKLKESGELIGIEVLDHVIIGDGRYWSWVEED